MASSMGKSTLGKGSDFYDDDSSNCQSCFVQGKQDILANSFCVDCHEYLCGNCSTYHNALKATKNHVLVTSEEAKKKAPPYKATKDKCSLKCTVHKDKTVKYFCVSHAYLGCSVCITMDHKQCTDVDYIPTVAEDIRNHDGFKKFDERLKALDTACKTGISDVEKNLKTIKADERQMKAAIQQLRKQLNDAVDKYEKELISKAMAVKSEETKLNVLSKDLATSLANVDTLAGKVANLLSSSKNCDTYVLMNKEADQLSSLEKELIKAVKGATCQRYEFQPNNDVLKADILGTLEIRSETVSFSAAVTAVAPVYKDGPTMAKLLKPGTRVRRGKDWNHGKQDGGGLGTVLVKVTRNNRPGWYRVKWDWGYEDFYRMGAYGAYDLEIA